MATGFRQTLACKLTPIALRVALGAVFLYAGYGKIVVRHEYSPAELAALANMGVDAARQAATQPGAPKSDEKKESKGPDAPGTPLPEPVGKPKRGSGDAIALGDAPGAQAPGGGVVSLAATTNAETQATSALPEAELFTPSRFERPASLKSLYMLALMLRAQNPDAGAGVGAETHRRALWPSQWSKGAWPVRWAWAAALTEFVGGALALIGLFARFAGLSLTVVMGVAMWLTVVGPSLGAEHAFLGFLPRIVPSGATPEAAQQSFQSWQMFLLQLTSLASALGVFLSGAGSLSLDGFLFSDKPAAPKAPPAQA